MLDWCWTACLSLRPSRHVTHLPLFSLVLFCPIPILSKWPPGICPPTGALRDEDGCFPRAASGLPPWLKVFVGTCPDTRLREGTVSPSPPEAFYCNSPGGHTLPPSLSWSLPSVLQRSTFTTHHSCIPHSLLSHDFMYFIFFMVHETPRNYTFVH